MPVEAQGQLQVGLAFSSFNAVRSSSRAVLIFGWLPQKAFMLLLASITNSMRVSGGCGAASWPWETGAMRKGRTLGTDRSGTARMVR
jgi:hypothetical protein